MIPEESKRDRFLMIVGGLGSMFTLYFIAFVLPLTLMAATSIGKGGVFTRPMDDWFSAYERFWGSSYYRSILFDSLELALLTTVVCVLLALPVAAFMVRGSTILRTVALVAVLSPLFTSVVVRSFGLELLFGDLLPTGSRLLVLMGLAQVLLPFAVLPLAASMANLDPLVLHAARTLGAGRVRSALRIALPVLMPGLWSGAVVTFLLALNNFAVPELLGQPDSPTLAQVVFQSATTLIDFAFAASVALSILLAALVLLGAGSLAMKRFAGLERL